jgi:putative glycosyltransferase
MKISIVATLYRSGDYINEFHERATTAVRQLTGDYELVFVNDGSPDDSLRVAVELARRDPRVVVVDLSRNFGHHKAMKTGLEHASGDRIFLIDSDLEEAPEWLADFSRAMDEAACDVVYGVQTHRKGGWFERVSGALFWKLFSYLTRLDFPQNPVTARLMSRRFVDALLGFHEREIFLHGLLHITGFAQMPLPVRKGETSPTTYSLKRKLALLSNSIVAFTSAPLVMIFQFGIIVFFLGLFITGWLLYRWVYYDFPVAGWASVMVSVWMLGGLIISFIGVVGIYLSSIYSETKQRPFTIVRDIYRS